MYTTGNQAAKVSILGSVLATPDLIHGSKLIHIARTFARHVGFEMSSYAVGCVLGYLVREGYLKGPDKATKTKGYASLYWQCADRDAAHALHQTLVAVPHAWFMDDLRRGETVTLTTPLSPVEQPALLYILKKGATLRIEATNPKDI
jgi:hypothetical protein